MAFKADGLKDVPVTIELCFEEGGKLSGVTEKMPEKYFLETGFGEYKAGDDTIRFGPGKFLHSAIEGLEGERYSTHFGSLKTNGQHVYLTGITPFAHTLEFS